MEWFLAPSSIFFAGYISPRDQSGTPRHSEPPPPPGGVNSSLAGRLGSGRLHRPARRAAGNGTERLRTPSPPPAEDFLAGEAEAARVWSLHLVLRTHDSELCGVGSIPRGRVAGTAESHFQEHIPLIWKRHHFDVCSSTPRLWGKDNAFCSSSF